MEIYIEIHVPYSMNLSFILKLLALLTRVRIQGSQDIVISGDDGRVFGGLPELCRLGNPHIEATPVKLPNLILKQGQSSGRRGQKVEKEEKTNKVGKTPQSSDGGRGRNPHSAENSWTNP